jgi:hypothetical protein
LSFKTTLLLNGFDAVGAGRYNTPLGAFEYPAAIGSLSGGSRSLLSQAVQDGAQTNREAVVVDVMVDTDVTPVAPHLVIGASQAVVHASFLSRL